MRKLQRSACNLVLMGAPGSGKTTIGSLMAKELGMVQFDVDDDLLEVAWGESVADKLAKLGDERFLAAEGEALQSIHKYLSSDPEKSYIISLSGSNPLHEKAMDFCFAQGWWVIYLDVPSSEIVQRMHRMKVNRIVGQGTTSLSEILAYRTTFYERKYDQRVLTTANQSPECIARQILQDLGQFPQSYIDVSDTYQSPTDLPGLLFGTEHSFRQPQQYLPKYQPSVFNTQQQERIASLTFPQRMHRILETFQLAPNRPSDLSALCSRVWDSSGGLISPNRISESDKNDSYSENNSKAQTSPSQKSMLHKSDNLYLVNGHMGPTGCFQDHVSLFYAQLLQSRKQDCITFIKVDRLADLSVLDALSLYPDQRFIAFIQPSQLSALESNLLDQIISQSTNGLFLSSTQFFSKDHLSALLQASDTSQGTTNQICMYHPKGWLQTMVFSALLTSMYLEAVQRGSIFLGQPMDVLLAQEQIPVLEHAVFHSTRLGTPFASVFGHVRTSSAQNQSDRRIIQGMQESLQGQKEQSSIPFPNFVRLLNKNSQTAGTFTEFAEQTGQIPDRGLYSALCAYREHVKEDPDNPLMVMSSTHFVHELESIAQLLGTPSSTSLAHLHLLSPTSTHARLQKLLKPPHNNLQHHPKLVYTSSPESLFSSISSYLR